MRAVTSLIDQRRCRRLVAAFGKTTTAVAASVASVASAASSIAADTGTAFTARAVRIHSCFPVQRTCLSWAAEWGIGCTY